MNEVDPALQREIDSLTNQQYDIMLALAKSDMVYVHGERGPVRVGAAEWEGEKIGPLFFRAVVWLEDMEYLSDEEPSLQERFRITAKGRKLADIVGKLGPRKKQG